MLSGLHSRFDPAIVETIQRVHDGQIGTIVAIEENFIRGPYGNTRRPEGLSEMTVQYGNQYRFSWLCGDDVTQSLVHNLDRATWACGDAAPELPRTRRSLVHGQPLGQCLRSSLRHLPLCQWRAVIRFLPDADRLLQRGLQYYPGDPGRGLSQGRSHRRNHTLGISRGAQRIPICASTKSFSGRFAPAGPSTAEITWSGALSWPSWASLPATAAKKLPGTR